MSEDTAPSCPNHPGEVATDICQRCGSFTCIQCKQLNPNFCPKCAQRHTAFFFNRSNLHLFDLLSATWNNTFKPYWLELSLAAFLTALLPTIVGYAFQIPSIISSGVITKAGGTSVASLLTFSFFQILFFILSVAAQSLTQCTLQRGLVEMSHTAWEGQRPTFNILFNFQTGVKATLASFLVAIPWLVLAGLGVATIVGVKTLEQTGAIPASGFVLALVVLLFVASAIALGIWMLPATLLFQPFAEKPDISIMGAMHLCFERCKGFRLQVFCLLLISMLISLMGILACCVGIFPAMAMVFAYQTGFWKALAVPGADSVGAYKI
ncbi:MAG: hypothetical protein FWC28_02145 [Proteobacteria bacterium]|nr:hypothetical protein [Cystobacterineae bacterium]MCL2259511.1 hypothetical protein [Cystobacterineae bacterium]MCL2314039.1 hypothetical protein [Pseudomonadota bacterium]